MSVFLLAVFIAAPVNTAAQTDIVGPPGSGEFGFVTVLPNGNIVVSDPFYDAGSTLNVGAVYLYNGSTLALISTLTGSTTGDRISSQGVWVLSNGNYVLSSPYWDNEAATDAGVVTWCSGTSGCSGAVTPANSLVGTQANDEASCFVQQFSNGNYVLNSPSWDNGAVTDAGAATWCSGASGCTGPVTTTNSLVGTQANDQVGGRGELVLSNGNYVVISPFWNNGAVTGAGAVTWCSGMSGCSAAVTTTNSLVGTQADDGVGFGRVLALSNGNYVVSSPYWNNGVATFAGAVTWGDGTGGTTTGAITNQNSVLGEAANGGTDINFAYDSYYDQLIVGRPADHKVTVVFLNFKIYLPLVKQ